MYVNKWHVRMSYPQVGVTLHSEYRQQQFVFIEKHRPTLCLKVNDLVGFMLEVGI